MFKVFRDAFKVPDLRKKIIYTLIMLFVIRLGAFITIPVIDQAQLKYYFSNYDTLGLLDAFSGGALQNMTLFAMGIIPYINSSIIMNLLTIAIPALEEMQKEGEDGRKKIAAITRYVTIGLALLQAIFMSIGLKSTFTNYNFFTVLIAIACLTSGTAFLMWIGERINDRGIGNGISIIMFVNILSRLNASFKTLKSNITTKPLFVGLILVVFFAMILLVVLIQLGERRIPVQYAKKMQGRRTYGGQSTHIPLKVNMAGVIPVIFASSLLQFPKIIQNLFIKTPPKWLVNVINFLDYTKWTGAMLYLVLIIAFAYFYTAIIFNPYEVANNMKKSGGFIPGIRPGKPTVEYLTAILNKIVLIGALLLAVVAISPIVIAWITKINLNFGGTSLIIVASVCLETLTQIESQLIMRHYKGFLNS